MPHVNRVGFDFGLCIDGDGLPFDLATATGFAGVLLAPPVRWATEADLDILLDDIRDLAAGF